MEKWKVMGYREVNFKDQDGREVCGYRLYLARPAADDRTKGAEVMTLFISSKHVDYEPFLDQIVMISFNRYGKVASIDPEV